MKGLVDSHCHLNYLQEPGEDPVKGCAKILDNAHKVGVNHCLCIGVDLQRLPEVIAIAEAYPQVKASAGIHPCDVSAAPVDAMDQLRRFCDHAEVIALGETGLDYYRPEGLNKRSQLNLFAEHIHLGVEKNLPLVVHTRSARSDTIACIQQEGGGKSRGVLHCFTEDITMARAALDLGYYLSFSGIITFKNAQEIRDVVAFCPLDRILVETDSPYLAPVPYRGKCNYPAYVVEVAKAVAQIKQQDFEAVARATTANCQQLFAWPE